jgi:NtrC-family two-component system sensor histidine kinase KinB
MGSLRTRFVVASLVILLATLVTGLWSGTLFVRLGTVVDRSLAGRQATIDLTATMATALEREDDALLLAVAGEVEHARAELAAERRAFDSAFTRLHDSLPVDERATAAALQDDVAIYRRKGDAMLAEVGTAQVRDRYHADVNPALRRAVAACSTLREHSFRALRDAGVHARDEAQRGTYVVAIVSLFAIGVAMFVALVLARSVLRPIRALTTSVDAMRRGDFQQRVQRGAPDELGRLTDGFNRMAESLAAFQSSNLGEVIRAKETLEATIGALPDPVIVVDPAGLIASQNPPARAILGAEIEPGARLTVLPELAATQARAVLDGVTPKPPDLRDAFAVTVHGERRTFLSTAVAIPFADGPAGAVVVLHDITEFVRVDTLRSELIAVTSHELKTPLTTLRLNLLLLGEEVGSLSSRHREILGMAVQGCEELARTIEGLLDLTRIEAGKLRLARERVDLGRIIDDVVAALAPRISQAELSVEVLRDSADACVRGDPLRLGVVISNLLTNALKYASEPRGEPVPLGCAASGGAITIRISRTDRVEVEVSDTGPGVPPDLRERVFEKFFRVAHVQPDLGTPSGAGIGLYVCRQIIEAHGGEIRCDGSRFVIRLDPDDQDPARLTPPRA